MATFTAPDGTRLAYQMIGDGDPLICLPGGPMQDADYLGDLGGLSQHRRLTLLDPRGTGRSEIPDDSCTYRCDRLVDDVEALRDHLDLAQIDLLGHSAGANLAAQYAARHPERVRTLALVTPSTMAVGIGITGEMRRAVAQLRSDEPWFRKAFAALESINTDQGTESDWEAIAPFYFGTWDGAAGQFYADASQHTNAEAARIFGSDGAFDPPTTRAALADCPAKVLLLFGDFDLAIPAALADAYANLFPHSTVVVQPGAGHYPWRDDAGQFVASVAAFLGDREELVRPASRRDSFSGSGR